MMKFNGAVFFDFDGTLVDGAENILKPTAKTKEAIQRLQDNHYLVGLATGRAKFYVPPAALLFDVYVTSNGAAAAADGTCISNHCIEPEELKRVTAGLDRIGMNYALENQEQCFVKDPKERYYLEMMRNFNLDGENFILMENAEFAFHQNINKLMVTYDAEAKLEQFRREFSNAYDITGQPGNQACDVGKKGMSKAFGVKKVMEFYGLDEADTYAFGDADNDYEMFRTVGFGIAMERHTEKLETVARYVTASVKDEGILKALVHLGLI